MRKYNNWICNLYRGNKILILGFVICLVFLCLSFLPYFINGEKSYLTLSDGLDGSHVYLKLGAENTRSGEFISGFPQPVGGVPRHRDLIPDVIEFLFLVFPPFYADIVNRILISLIAFMGMFLLLKHLNRTNAQEYQNHTLILGVSLAFALSRFWPYAGISVAGLPLLFYGYECSDKKFPLSVLIALFYVLYSSLALVGIYLVAALIVYEFVKLIRKNFSYRNLLFIIFLCLFYTIANLDLVMSVTNPLFVSHRSEFNLVEAYPTIFEALKLALRMFFTTKAHNSGYSTLIIILSLLAIGYLKINKGKPRPRFIALYIIYISLIFISFLFNNKLTVSIQNQVPVLGMLQLQRFYWLLIPLQYLIFYEALLCSSNTKIKKIVYFILVLQVCILLYHANLIMIKHVAKKIIGKPELNVNYAEFYSKSLFNSIEQYIGLPQNTYRVVSVGISPAVALYNGFYTIDGYWSQGYPLEHKNRFGEAIEQELAKNPKLARYFYDWGSPCYLFSDEIDREIGYPSGHTVPIIRKDTNVVIDTLSINSNVLESMNCRYVFSSLPVANHEEIHLRFERSFEDDISPYRVFLYSIVQDSLTGEGI